MDLNLRKLHVFYSNYMKISFETYGIFKVIQR